MSFQKLGSFFERDPKRKDEEKRAVEILEQIDWKLSKLIDLLTPHFPTSGIITQGDKMAPIGTITGLAPGASDQFFCTPVDVNGNPDQLPAGSPQPVFTASDPGVVIGPPAVADPTGNSCTVTAPAGATPGGNFTLTWTAQYNAPALVTITATATVPYLTPPVLEPQGGVISQGAPAAVSAQPALKIKK